MQSSFKLIDVPEMNYTHNDKDENGNPAPRGEVCIRSNGNMVAYYKNEKATVETITEDGIGLIQASFLPETLEWSFLMVLLD